jgi:hypothetical protein
VRRHYYDKRLSGVDPDLVIDALPLPDR